MRILKAEISGQGAQIVVGLSGPDVDLLVHQQTRTDKEEAEALEKALIQRIVNVLRGIQE